MAAINGYQQRVAKAIADPAWQKFRVSMKGTKTDTKLAMLRSYLKKVPTRDGVTQVNNYLKALSRGGLIEPTGTYIEDLKAGTLKILR